MPGVLKRQASPPITLGSDDIGEMGPSDWLNQPIFVGSLIVFGCETRDRVRQVALAKVVSIDDLGGCTADIIRRSKTGKPSATADRKRVKLSASGVANATVLDKGF